MAKTGASVNMQPSSILCFILAGRSEISVQSVIINVFHKPDVRSQLEQPVVELIVKLWPSQRSKLACLQILGVHRDGLYRPSPSLFSARTDA